MFRFPAVAALAVSWLVFSSPMTLAQNENLSSADREVRAAYARVEAARGRMSGNLSEEEQTKRFSDYREAARSFVDDYASNSERLTVGHLDLGRAYLDLQDPASAAVHLKRFLDRVPGHAEIQRAELFLGDCYRSTNRLPEAISLYTNFPLKYPRSEDKPYAALGLGTSYFLNLQFDRALTAFDALTKAFPEHEASADAAFQSIDALIYSDRFAEAKKRLEGLDREVTDAPEIKRKLELLNLLGKPAPALQGVESWIGGSASTLERNRRRVVVLTFFMNKSIPSTLMLQFVSELERKLRGQPVTLWGLTKAYKAGQAPDWTMALEAKWLARYRKNPRYVLQRELRRAPDPNATDVALWKALEKPISTPLILAKGFDNHRAYAVRGVPCVVVIDKTGKIRMIEQGGQATGGFQTRLIERRIQDLAAE